MIAAPSRETGKAFCFFAGKLHDEISHDRKLRGGVDLLGVGLLSQP